MHHLESDTIGGYNSFLEKQKAEKGDAYVTTVLFDDKYEVLHNRVDIKTVQPITNKEYFAKGMTALLDAVGRTICDAEHHQNFADKNETPAKTIVVIITDGMENSSKEYTLDTVKKMVTAQQEKHGWEFIFLGANIDAVKTAGNFGIAAERAVNFHNDSIGTAKNFMGVTAAVSAMRQKGKVGGDWRKEIDEDFESRKEKH